MFCHSRSHYVAGSLVRAEQWVAFGRSELLDNQLRAVEGTSWSSGGRALARMAEEVQPILLAASGTGRVLVTETFDG